MTTTTETKPRRETLSVRVDPVDREALEAEQRRRAAAGKVADRSELVREAIRAAYGSEGEQ